MGDYIYALSQCRNEKDLSYVYSQANSYIAYGGATLYSDGTLTKLGTCVSQEFSDKEFKQLYKIGYSDLSISYITTQNDLPDISNLRDKLVRTNDLIYSESGDSLSISFSFGDEKGIGGLIGETFVGQYAFPFVGIGYVGVGPSLSFSFNKNGSKSGFGLQFSFINEDLLGVDFPFSVDCCFTKGVTAVITYTLPVIEMDK